MFFSPLGFTSSEVRYCADLVHDEGGQPWPFGDAQADSGYESHCKEDSLSLSFYEKFSLISVKLLVNSRHFRKIQLE